MHCSCADIPLELTQNEMHMHGLFMNGDTCLNAGGQFQLANIRKWCNIYRTWRKKCQTCCSNISLRCHTKLASMWMFVCVNKHSILHNNFCYLHEAIQSGQTNLSLYNCAYVPTQWCNICTDSPYNKEIDELTSAHSTVRLTFDYIIIKWSCRPLLKQWIMYRGKQWSL